MGGKDRLTRQLKIEDLEPETIGRVLTHPFQVEALTVVESVIEQLRTLDSGRDYYEWQRRLVGSLPESERGFAEASREWKRSKSGKAAEPPHSGWDLHDLSMQDGGNPPSISGPRRPTA